MPTTADFLTAAQWAGLTTLAFAGLAILAFFLQWGIRFRLVGVTGFMGVLTGGLFALGLVPFMHTVVPGAVPFTVTYDNGGPQAVISVPKTITETQLEATLRQAANDLFSYGRMGGQGSEQLMIRARTIIHPKPGLTQPLYLGQVKRSLAGREDTEMAIEIFRDQFAQIAKTSA